MIWGPTCAAISMGYKHYERTFGTVNRAFISVLFVYLQNDELFTVSQHSPSQRAWAKKKHDKKCHISEKKPHNFSKKKTKQKKTIIIDLKRVFCLILLHKTSIFNMSITTNYLF